MKKRQVTPLKQSPARSSNSSNNTKQDRGATYSRSSKFDAGKDNNKHISSTISAGDEELRNEIEMLRQEKAACELKLKKSEDKNKRHREELTELYKKLEENVKDAMDFKCARAEAEYLRERVDELESTKSRQRSQLEALVDQINELKLRAQDNENIISIKQKEIDKKEAAVQDLKEQILNLDATIEEQKSKYAILAHEHDKHKTKSEATAKYLRVQIKATNHQRDEMVRAMDVLKSAHEQSLRDKNANVSLVIELQAACAELTADKQSLEQSLKEQIEAAATQDEKLRKANLSLNNHWNEAKALLDDAKVAKNLLTSRLFESALSVSKLEAELQKESTARSQEKNRLSIARDHIVSLRSQLSYLNTCLSCLLQLNEESDDCDECLRSDLVSVDQKLHDQLIEITNATVFEKQASVASGLTIADSPIQNATDTCVAAAGIAEVNLSNVAIQSTGSAAFPKEGCSARTGVSASLRQRHLKDVAVNTIVTTAQLSLPTPVKSTSDGLGVPVSGFNHNLNLKHTTFRASSYRNDLDDMIEGSLVDEPYSADKEGGEMVNVSSIDALIWDALSSQKKRRADSNAYPSLKLHNKSYSSAAKKSTRNRGFAKKRAKSVSGACFNLSALSASLPSLHPRR